MSREMGPSERIGLGGSDNRGPFLDDETALWRAQLSPLRRHAPPGMMERVEFSVLKAIRGRKPAPAWQIYVEELWARPAVRWMASAAALVLIGIGLWRPSSPTISESPARVMLAQPVLPAVSNHPWNDLRSFGQVQDPWLSPLWMMPSERLTNLLGDEIILYPRNRIEDGRGGLRMVRWDF